MDLIQTAQEILYIKQNYTYYLNFAKLREQKVCCVNDSDFEIHIFEQTWGNTSGGFEGVGGCAMTTQTTYVLVPLCFEHDCLIFFGGRFAYLVPYNNKLKEDIRNQNIKGMNKKGYYLANESEQK